MPTVTRVLRKSWSSTLQLPKSTFPPRPSATEKALYLERCSDDLYSWQRRERPAENTFVLHDGPPYANGSLHLGHALNKVLKDIICRFQLSQGKRVDYVPGWDCHGLPIELKALEAQKELTSESGSGGSVLNDPMAVRQVARQLAERTVEEQLRGFKQWGIMADWAAAWKTMDKAFEIKQLGIFQNMVEKGLVYRRFKPVYWSPSSGTALAEAELEYKDDHRSNAAYVRFRISEVSEQVARIQGVDQDNLSAVIWTTTPWTLPANKAIAVRSDIEYSIIEVSEAGQLLVAKIRIPHVCKACHIDSPRVIVDSILGAAFAGSTKYINSLQGSTAKAQNILHADFVSADSGTGLVHLAPGHGMDDYQVCNQHGIAAFAPVDDAGRFTVAALASEPGRLANKEVLWGGAREVLLCLGDLGHILGTEKYTHKYPYDWRTKQPVIVRATEQWFADVGSIKDAALASLKNVQFIPSAGRGRLESFIRGRNEWCISRQRAWGVPIPALYHKESGEALLTSATVGHIINVIAQRGIDAWWSDPGDEPAWTPPDYLEPSGRSNYRRGKDTMDVWFDSGTSWTQNKRSVKRHCQSLANMYLEGSDQHRGWFQSSLLTYIAQQNTSADIKPLPQAPFETLITHGFTLGPDGRKMSKSLGNVYSPDIFLNGQALLPPMTTRKIKRQSIDVKAKYATALGPDALRLWVAGSDFTKDVIIGKTVLEGINASMTKFRVTFKLLLGALQDFDPQSVIEYGNLTSIDKVALHQLSCANYAVLRMYKKYDFSNAMAIIKHWVSVHLSAFYIEVSKDRLYADEPRGLSRLAVQTVLLHAYTFLSAMLAPVTPLLVEESWAHIPARIGSSLSHPLRCIHPETPGYWYDEALAADFAQLLSAKQAVNVAQERARSEKKIGSSLQSSVILYVPGGDKATAAFELLHRYNDELGALFVVYDVSLSVGKNDLYADLTQLEWKYSASFSLGIGAEATAWIVPSAKAKCARCWRYAVPVVAVGDRDLCGRCQHVVKRLKMVEPGRVEGDREGPVAAQVA
ncbi:MAG: isoleucine-tRNA ligase [Candelina mexicana]|nr:MAG: isoleucine-tRNA ligase [Candelina mexicana]